jgi:hypothetical protein
LFAGKETSKPIKRFTKYLLGFVEEPILTSEQIGYVKLFIGFDATG